MTSREHLQSRLKEGEVIFDYDMPTMALRELAAKGLIPVCPRCKAPLEFALSPAEAKEKRVSPGVRCPKNPNHFQTAIYFADPLPRNE